MVKEYTIGGVRVSFPYDRAYPSQIAMMNKIISALERGSNALLESPTGSGKSLALLCASLAWQNLEGQRVREYNASLEDDLIPDSDFPLGDDDDEEENGEPEEGLNGFMTDGREVELVPIQGNKRKKKRRVPKIYFGTRTHKQITQIIRELRRTAYKDVEMTILGSREHSCIHPEVSKLKSGKTEACKELTDKRKGDYSGGCNFLNNVKSRMHSHHSLSAYRKTKEAWDLEDLIAVGRKSKTCPYFVSRELMPTARIVFCPYNYLIEPMIRKSLEINLKGNILILDEAHNIEDSARSAASFSVTQEQIKDSMNDLESIAKSTLPEAHGALASLCSKLSNWIDGSCSNLNDYSDFNSSSKVWSGTEILAIFRLFGLNEEEYNKLSNDLKDVAEEQSSTLSEISEGNYGGSKKGPLPPILTNATLGVLEGFFFIFGNLFKENSKYRDDYRVALTRAQVKKSNDSFNRRKSAGSFDSWMSKSKKDSTSLGHSYSLHFWCLNPALSFIDVKEELRSVILTSGTLSPMVSFSSELDVPFPITLEASHVIDKKQLFISTAGFGPRGHSLNATFRNTESFVFQDELGRTILEICNTSRNGILLFLPSYRLLSKLSERWSSTGLWQEIERSKIILEEPRFAHEFESCLRHYCDVIKETENTTGEGVNGALLMAVCRGKVSEGIDFADAMARVVICVGIPFPNVKDPQVDLKKRFNDAKKLHDNRILTGNEWYEIQAFRALNQALGRCIRHRNDWGAIIMVDDRYSKYKRYIDGLSKWVRSGVAHFHRFDDLIGRLKEFDSAMRTWEKELKKDLQLDKEIKNEEENIMIKTELVSDRQHKPKKKKRSNETMDEVGTNPNSIKKPSLDCSPLKCGAINSSSEHIKNEPKSPEPKKSKTISQQHVVQYVRDSDDDFM